MLFTHGLSLLLQTTLLFKRFYLLRRSFSIHSRLFESANNLIQFSLAFTKVSPFLNLFQFFQPVPRIFFIMRREFWHEK
ncbi:conserved hypothetical protein [delta proteobacterium NaphS2]|nr:conserved hypothetical protein [delta proteobacterium NaphS2]